MRTIALGITLLFSCCAVTLDVPRGGCLNYRSYSYRIPNPYRSGSLGEISGTRTYVGDRPSSAAEESRILLADPATRPDEVRAERERSVSRAIEGVSGALVGVGVAPVTSGLRGHWSEGDTIATATMAGTGLLGWGISYAIMVSSKKHAERARRIFNDEAAATGQCPASPQPDSMLIHSDDELTRFSR